MTQCIGVKPNRELCQGVAIRGSDYCPAHDPARKEARRRSASKAARSKKPRREISDIKAEVAELIQAVRNEEMDRADAIACGQLYNTVLRAITVDIKIKEVEEIEGRLEQLEDLLAEKKESSRW